MSNEKRYGHIVNGSHTHEGLTLNQVKELCDSALKFEESVDEVLGDLCVTPQIMKELVEEVEQLRAQLVACASV